MSKNHILNGDCANLTLFSMGAPSRAGRQLSLNLHQRRAEFAIIWNRDEDPVFPLVNFLNASHIDRSIPVHDLTLFEKQQNQLESRATTLARYTDRASAGTQTFSL